MKKTLIATIIASVVLTGCGPSDAEIAAQKAADQKAWLEQFQAQQAQEEADLNKQLAEKKNAEDAELAGIVAELKKGDPAIKDAYYGYNEKGERTLHVVRDNTQDQNQQAQQGYQQGSNQPVIINNQPAQAASSGVSETVWPLLAGAGAGMLLANAMNSGGGFSNYSQNHRPYSSNYYNDSDYRRERTKVVNNYRTVVVKETRDSYRQSPTYKQKYPIQYQSFQQKPQVKTNTGSSVSQGSSWASSKPKVSQPVQATKPVTSNSSWGSSTPSRSSFSQSKPAQPKVSSNSGWGSSSSSTQSKPKVSSSSSWGGSSSGFSSKSSGSSFKSSSSRSSSSFSSSRRR